MVKVFIDGQTYQVDENTPLRRVFELAGLDMNKVVGGKVNGVIYDLQTPTRKSIEIKPIYKDDPESLEILRHSLAHIMAHALKEVYGKEKVHLGVGPTTEDGFYYDVEIEDVRLSEDDLPRIEEKMREIIERDYPIIRKEVGRNEAVNLFSGLKEKYKLEVINRIGPEDVISVYEQNDFVDLCRGPHLASTGMAGAFKLTHIAGAYWMGDPLRPMLQRIYGVAFWNEEELKKRLTFYEEARKRDHRKLGKELELFLIDESVGPGFIIWLPKGGIYRKVLEDYWKEEHLRRGYQLVYTPHVGKADLWRTSGHLDYYKPNMFPQMSIEKEEYFLKPMNCPFHVSIYKSKVRSYRELPLRLAELGTVYRYEMSGVLHGLMRVRGFTQDDAHIICTPEQVEDVIHQTLDFAVSMLKDFGFRDFEVYISTKPLDAIGSEEQWQLAEGSLRKAVQAMKMEYKVDEGGGAFYGPKIDVKIKDAIGRLWQCSTIQFDFNLPERFDMTYVGQDNRKHRPYMIHRALLGSIERFTGVLLEHYAGFLPLWLSPLQVRIVPVSEKHTEYAMEIEKRLKEEGIRVDLDDREERVGARIRDAEIQKIPYVVVVGAKEVEERSVSVRGKKEGNMGSFLMEEFIRFLKGKIQTKEA
ncbi:MAG: threonine--tRNA ligase [Aquificaceae bacterium]